MVGERDGWGIPYNNKGGQVHGLGSRIEDRSTVKGGQDLGLRE